MSNIYIGYYFTIEPRELGSEILVAELGEKAFESFTETENGISAFVKKDLWDENILDDIYILQSEEFKIEYTIEEIDQVNWNEEWEKNFEPIDVDGKCHVRAPFHEKTDAKYDIVIEPKMSFGTGHHATTYQVLRLQGEIDHQGKRVLDVGSGTGILAIMAHLLGAKEVEAFDIDDWCVDNGNENFDLNGLTTRMGLGTIRQVNPQGPFDIVLANINKNVLLDELKIYADLLLSGGYLLLSGFYTEDIEDLVQEANKHGLELLKTSSKDNWAALILQKN